MKRRAFFLLAATGMAGVTFPVISCRQTGFVFDPVLARPQSLALICEVETMQVIGKTYRRKFPEEGSEENLVRLIMDGIPPGSSDLSLTLARKVREDFREGRMVMIEGWLLALTEARQCALFSLTW